MSVVIQALAAALRLAAEFVPEKFKGILQLAASLITNLKLGPSDPRVEKVAELVTELTEKLKDALKITDSDARETARLLLENQFLRGYAALVEGGEQ